METLQRSKLCGRSSNGVGEGPGAVQQTYHCPRAKEDEKGHDGEYIAQELHLEEPGHQNKVGHHPSQQEEVALPAGFPCYSSEYCVQKPAPDSYAQREAQGPKGALPQLVEEGCRANVLDGIGHLARFSSYARLPGGVAQKLRQIDDGVGGQDQKHGHSYGGSHHSVAHHPVNLVSGRHGWGVIAGAKEPEAVDQQEGKEQWQHADFGGEGQPHKEAQEQPVPQPTMVHHVEHEPVGRQHQEYDEGLWAVEVAALNMDHRQGHEEGSK